MHSRLFAVGLLSASLFACGAPEDQGAAPEEVTARQAALGSCFNNGCNGLDPGTSGCEADAYTVASAAISFYGTVNLRYSPSCSAAWTRAVSYAPAYLIAQAIRSSPSYFAQAASPAPVTALRSPMVGVSTGKTVTAIGRIGVTYQGSISYTF